jgi:hypothetical protein
MSSLMSRLIKAFPLLLPGLCFIAFPIALNPLMNQDEHGRLSLAGVAAGCWMVVVLLGLQAIPSQGSAEVVHSSTQIRRRILSQLVLFAMGVLLMVIAIKF